MTDVPSIVYYHDASSTYNLFGLPQGKVEFPGRDVSPATGVVHDPQLGSATRAFDEITVSANLSIADWYALRADLKGATTYGGTYPYLVFNYQSGSSLSLLVMALAFAWVQINQNEFRVTLTFRERKA
jgi:hypothetical protein